MANRRRTIGLLMNNLFDEYVLRIWNGMIDEAERLDLNLLCFVGGTFTSDIRLWSQRPALYELPSPANIDGLVSVTAAICSRLPHEERIRFVSSFTGIPLVNIGETIEGFPSVFVDNASGMHALMEHLILDHGYERIAFINGPDENPEARARLAAYRGSLERHMIPYDDSLVVPGNFTRRSGGDAVAVLLDERKVRFAAIAAANDLMALQAVMELKKRGIRVPEDIAVTGFDDLPECRAEKPALTTVRQSGDHLARAAVGLLLEMMDGKRTIRTVTVPTRLIRRFSCGCRDDVSVFSDPHAPAGTDTSVGDLNAACLIAVMEEFVPERIEPQVKMTWAKSLSDALSDRCLNGNAGFERVLGRVVNAAYANGVEISAWYRILGRFLDACVPGIAPALRAEILREAFVCIAAEGELVRIRADRGMENQLLASHRISNEINSQFKLGNLKNLPSHALEDLGVGDIHVCMYDGGAQTRSESLHIVSYFADGSLHGDRGFIEGTVFPSRELVPGGLFTGEKRRSYAVLDLFFQADELGFTVIEIRTRSGLIYEILSDHFSSALKGELLLSELKDQASLLEKEVRNRTADLIAVNEALVKKNTEIEHLLQIIEEKNRTDTLTRVYTRETVLEMLEREKKRSLRMLWRSGNGQNPEESGSPAGKDAERRTAEFDHRPEGGLSEHIGVFSLMMLDIDNFKQINDMYGHVMGDRVLEAVGTVLRRKDIFRDTDPVGRFGGDEFMVILPETNAEHALRPAGRLKEAVQALAFSSETGETFGVTVSIGISQFLPSDTTEEDIIQRADRALYAAKRRGRNIIEIFLPL